MDGYLSILEDRITKLEARVAALETPAAPEYVDPPSNVENTDEKRLRPIARRATIMSAGP